jgi:uncharacterized membrane protein
MIGIKNINLGCHGIADRCFLFRGRPMPFCSRCLGCSVGHIFSFLLFIFGFLPNLAIATVFILPLAIDWLAQEFFGIISNNWRRLFTGILGGFGIGIMIWKSLMLVISFL